MSTPVDMSPTGATLHASGDMEGKFCIDDLINALNAEQPNEEAKIKMDFAELFPATKAALDRGVPPKQLIELMTKKGLKLHHASFRKLWQDEVRRRSTNGEIIRCDACGAPRNPERDGNAPNASSFGESGDVASVGVINEL